MNRQGADRTADVIVLFKAQSQDCAVSLDGSFGLELLRASVAARHHVFAPILDPFHRSAGFHRQ